MTGWQLRTLEEIVDFSNGLNFSEKNDGVGLKIVRVKDFGDRHFVDWTELSEINPTGLKTSEKVYLEPNDIVIVRSNGNKDLVGRSMIYAGPARTTVFAGFCIRARVRKSQALPKFVHYWLRSPTTREKLSREGGGTGIQNVSQGLLKMQEIALPSLSEQERISGTLAALDDKIELNRRMSATLEEMARALYRSWFVDFDPVHARALGQPPAHMDATTATLFPDSFGPDGLPKGWEREPLEKHVRATRGLSYKGKHLCGQNDGVPLHNLKSIISGGGYQDEGIKYYNGEFKARHEVRPGDLIVANTDLTQDFHVIGNAALVPAWLGLSGILSQHLYKVEIRSGSPLSKEWLYLALSIAPLGMEIRGFSNGTTVNMLPADAFEIPETAIPPAAIVEKMNEIVRPAFTQQERLREESRTLAALRDALLPRLMSGELRIRDAEKQVEEVV